MSGSNQARSVSRTTSSVQNILRSGSPRVLKVITVAQELKRTQENPVLLFRSTALNRAVLFKDVHAPNAAEDNYHMRIGTKIYVPFDGNQLEDGGMTIFFSRYTFFNAMRDMIDLSLKEYQDDLNADILILEHLNMLPTFAPFLVKECFERNGIVADPLYSDIPQNEWEEIQIHIRGRFSQILRAVSGEQKASSSKQAAMDKLIDKLWDLKDIPALQNLATAFGLDPTHCVETFYAWKGILYFSWVSEQVYETANEMLKWLDGWQQLLVVFPPNQHAEAKGAFMQARQLIAKMLNRVTVVLNEYNEAFEELFVSGSGSHRFVQFLGSASEHFQTCGACLGLLQHSYEVWNNATKSFPDRRANSETILQALYAIEDIIPG